MIKNIKTSLLNTFSKIDIAFIIIPIVLCALTMHYADITVTSQFGLTMWDSLFDGKLLSFYQNCLDIGIAPEGAVYDIGMYIVFAIWGLPVWILQKIFHFSAMAAGVQLWFKLLVTSAYLFCCYPIKRIVDNLVIDKETIPELMIMYILTPLAWMPVLVAAQYDVLPLFFVLLGTSYILENNKWRFIACFAFACIMKPFAMFMLLGVILYYEKNILLIIRDFVASLIPFAVVKLLYSLTPGYSQSSGAFMGNGLEGLFGINVNIGATGITAFFLVLAAIYIYSYVKDTMDDLRFGEDIIWISTAIWMCFVLIGGAASYQAVYLAPFIVLLLYSSVRTGRHFDRILVVELVFEVCLAVVYIMKFSWVYGGSATYKYLVFSGIWNRLNSMGESATICGMFNKFMPMDMLLPAIGTVLIVAGITLLVISFKEYNKHFTNKTYRTNTSIWHIRIRYILMWMWFVLCLGAMILGGMGY